MYYGFGRRSLGLSFLLILLGIALILGCIRGLMNREGMYDSESTSIMFWSQILGIVLGVALVLIGFNVFEMLGGLF
ncbi:hypothetical protein IT575_08120 [bacterium]|nr:hypothetical protein [bacterium]